MDALDMPLDTLVKKSKISGRGGSRARRGRGRGRGTSRLTQSRGAGGGYLGPRSSGLFRKGSRYRSGPFGISKQNRGAAAGALWQQGLLDEGARLYVSNLDSGVTNEDIKELFSEIGELKYCSVHYDKLGRSKGTAEVYFARREHALIAMKRYNNVQLDGKPMIIDVIGGAQQLANGFVAPPPRVQRPFVNSTGGRGAAAGTRRPGREIRGRGRGRGRGGKGRGGGRAPQKSLDELNAELDKYHSQVMDVA